MLIHFDPQGLIPVVIQDASDGRVLMVASMNEEALNLTRSTGYTHLFSRSRNKLWRKGEESGNVQEVRGIYVNCEENSLLLQVVQHGGAACHTGYRSCYYRQILPDGSYETIEERIFDPAQVYGKAATEAKGEPAAVKAVSEEDQQKLAASLRQLYSVYLYLRDHDLSNESYTSRLLQERSTEYLVTRLGDELQELADVQTGTHFHTGRQDDTILEASQVGYWLLLLAATRNIQYDEVQLHEAVLGGYATSLTPQTLGQSQECLNLLLSDDLAEVRQGLILGFVTIGRTCAEAGVSPLAPAEYDLAQMRRKGLVSE
jgi:phosphoribosyl-AMP cyclohydrolase/phosphoribosyl-ATP pyrophosphohydrolase